MWKSSGADGSSGEGENTEEGQTNKGTNAKPTETNFILLSIFHEIRALGEPIHCGYKLHGIEAVGTGLFAHSITHSLALLTRLIAAHCSLLSRAPLRTILRSLARSFARSRAPKTEVCPFGMNASI